MAKTLEELKAENAAKEAEETETPQVDVETEEVEAVEEEAEETEEVAETSDEEAEETETEAWMQADEQTSDYDGSAVPIAKHVSMRNKLKGTVKEKDSEIETLKAEIEALKGVKYQPVQTQYNLPPRPTLEQFDYDETKHNAALDEWYDAKMDARINSSTQTANIIVQQEQAKKALETAVDRHYENAEKLIEESGISPDVYKQADAAVRGMLEAARPGQGDTVADYLISTLGEGSEKVMYYIGRNKSKLAEIHADLISDPSGMKAMAKLGRISAEVSAPTKRKSNAPKPSRQIQGDAGTQGNSEKALKKKYNAAKDAQTRFNIRREAKKSGVNVSNW